MEGNSTSLYTAYGLSISSPIPLPELYSSDREPEVRIVFGTVPDELSENNARSASFQAKNGIVLLLVNRIAKFLVSNGNSIVIEPYPGCDEDSLRLFLLDVAFGALLHQRSGVVLQSSSIQTKNGCVCFAGTTGVGKSTLAAGFLKKGYHLLTDDVCPITIDQHGRPSVVPGYPVLKLWQDSLIALGEDPSSYHQPRPAFKKYNKPVKDQFYKQPLPISHIYILSTTNGDEIERSPILGFKKVTLLKNQTYRYQYLKGLGLAQSHFTHCIDIGKKVTITQIKRPQRPFNIEAMVELITEDLTTN